MKIIHEEYNDCSKIKYLYHSVFSKNAEDYVDKNGITTDNDGYIYLSTYPYQTNHAVATYKVTIPNNNYLYDWREFWYDENEEPLDAFEHEYDESNPYYIYMLDIPVEYIEKINSSTKLHIDEDYEEPVEFLTKEISLIPATDEDVKDIAKWELETTAVSYPNGKIPEDELDDVKAELLQDAKDSVWKTKMIQYEGKTIGMMTSYQIDLDWYDGWYIGEIYLIPEYRGMGIGRIVMQNEIDNHDLIRLNVFKDNKHAIELYKSLGFEIIQDNDDAWIMEYTKD